MHAAAKYGRRPRSFCSVYRWQAETRTAASLTSVAPEDHVSFILLSLVSFDTGAADD